MKKHKILSGVIILLFILAGLLFITLAFLPFGSLSLFFGSLLADGEFESLTPDNLNVMRWVLGGLSVFNFAVAGMTWRQRWGLLMGFLGQLWQDTRRTLLTWIPRGKEAAWLLAVLLLVVLALIHRLEFIFSSLHHDEAYTYMAFSHSLRAALSDYHLPNNHVFHSLLVLLSTRIFGNAPWVVRLPAFTAGILLIPALFRLGSSLYNRWVGLAAGILAALSPALVNYSYNARGYSMVALFGVWLLTLGVVVTRERNRFAWLLIILLSCLGMFTIPAFLFPFGVLFIWLIFEACTTISTGYSSRIEFLKYWGLSGIISAFLTLVLYLPLLFYSGPRSLFQNEFVSSLAWQDFFETIVQRMQETWSEWTFRVPGWVILLCLVGILVGLVFHSWIAKHRVPTLLAALAWITLLLLVQRPNAWSKVWVFLIPLALLWSAAGLIGLPSSWKVRNISIGGVASLLLLAVAMAAAIRLVPELPGLWALQGDEETAVLFACSQDREDAGLLVAPPDDAPVWYYAELHDCESALYRSEANYQTLLVFVNRGKGQSPASVLDERGPGQSAFPTCSLMETFGKIEVFKCREKP